MTLGGNDPKTPLYRRIADDTGTVIGPTNPLPTSSINILTQKMENLTSGQALYIGEAVPGTATSATGWRIRKLEYGNGNSMPPTGVTWADGTNAFTKVWDSRATYSYS